MLCKGAQWCNALATFEAMQAAGSQPHTAVFSSIIDVLWQTGILWAQAKALQLFSSAVACAPFAYLMLRGLGNLLQKVLVVSVIRWLCWAARGCCHCSVQAVSWHGHGR